MTIIFSKISKIISGEISGFPDKSISHRAIIFSSFGCGVSKIQGLLNSEDVINTMECFKSLGVSITKNLDDYIVNSKGFYAFAKSEDSFYMGNSGTSARLISGVLSGIHGKTSKITGDASLSKRPMARVINPLLQMGADIKSTDNKVPLEISGVNLKGINYTMEVPSAQVKSAILLAGLFAHGETMVIETDFTRDHTENMLKNLGVNIDVSLENKKKIIALNNNQKEIKSANYVIPNDFSSASFFIALALITPKSEVIIRNVNLNPLRTGFLSVVKEMGADIEVLNYNDKQGESAGDIVVKSSNLKGIKVDPKLVPSMIDEFPILSIVACFASGKTELSGVGELRHKESDRISAMVHNLNKLGVSLEEKEDSLIINGKDADIQGGVVIESFLDHRIAMSFLILGSMCKEPLEIHGCESIATSFPNFFDVAKSIGLNLEIKKGN
jgi:3-phosphoshikimate 1-carboxyvinyltransferase